MHAEPSQAVQGRFDRLIGLGLALPALLVLGLALWLDPDPVGVGTHQQFGMPPCIVLSQLGIPCPMCGMTTTFALMADLRPWDSFANQPMGFVFFWLCAFAAGLGLLEAISPRRRWEGVIRWLSARDVALVAALLVGLLGAWAYKIILVSEMSNSFP